MDPWLWLGLSVFYGWQAWLVWRERREWAAERREMLNRIQHPWLVPGETVPETGTASRRWDDLREARHARRRRRVWDRGAVLVVRDEGEHA